MNIAIPDILEMVVDLTRQIFHLTDGSGKLGSLPSATKLRIVRNSDNRCRGGGASHEKDFGHARGVRTQLEASKARGTARRSRNPARWCLQHAYKW